MTRVCLIWKELCPGVRRRNSRALIWVLAISLLTIGVAVSRSAAQDNEKENLNWRYYGNDPGNMRYQNVDQINPTNVSRLKPAWVFHTGVHDKDASMETTPIVLNGVMYLTSGDDDVFAVKAGTGTQIWAYHPTDLPPISKLPLCCGHNNRGVAAGGGRLYLARLDATLVALNQSTGQQLWKTTVDDWHNGYTMTIPPQYVNGLVIVGVSGGEYFIRGHVDAYNAKTGSRVWRFYTTDPNTFAGDSWKRGGGPVWQNPSFDLQLGMMYFSVGNTGPDINGVPRAGTNLYTACVVAVDIATGALRWYFQESHHDLWDYDATPPTMLFTLNGTPAIAHVGKTGYLFVLDRRTGTPLYNVIETPVPTEPAWQNPWPTQPVSTIESLAPHEVGPLPAGYTGAPQWTPPQETTYAIQPGDSGGTEWPPSAFSPRTNFIYHHARYAPTTFYTTPTNTSGGTFPGWGSITEDVPGVDYGLYGAVDSTTGKIVWKIKVSQALSGMTVGGDLVFFGDNSGLFYGVNALTGQILWTFNGLSIKGAGAPTAAPVVYMVDGREYVAMAFGGQPDSDTPLGDAMVAFALPTH
ncbi:MAG: hypothetical protein DMG99_10320 [Acidobacteria bacterium]|nr:MAG: hypothetical protein DMG99_10320 [Acidobacteriota bacterium]